MKVIDGKGAVLGRMASQIAKDLMKGEEVSIINCDDVIITGNKSHIKEEFENKRKKVGSGQKGPKVSRLTERIVKRAVRGMLPNHRMGRGKEAYKRLKCYSDTPKELENAEKISLNEKSKRKPVRIKDIG